MNLTDSRIDQVTADTLRQLDASDRDGWPPGAPLEPSALAGLIDHTLLRPDEPPESIRELCDQAVAYGFAAVCVQPVYCALAASRLRGDRVATACVLDFPHGCAPANIKNALASELVGGGADELDMVVPVGLVKACDWEGVYEHVSAVVIAARAAQGRHVLVKAIIETGLLTDREKVAACTIVESAGADFVKTSTGFSGIDSTVRDVHILALLAGDRMGVKAAGGIRTAIRAREMVAAGADRIGTSAGIDIVDSA